MKIKDLIKGKIIKQKADLSSGKKQTSFAAPHPLKEKEIDDILLKQNGKSFQIGFWKQGKNIWQGTNSVHTNEWKPLGLYDLNGDGHADLPFMGIFQRESCKILCIGFYQNGIDQAKNWRNIASLTTPKDAEWSVTIGNFTGRKNGNSILWFSAQYGKLGLWVDGTPQWVEIPGCWKNWSVLGHGDYNGSGKATVLMRFDPENRYYSVDQKGKLEELGNLASDWTVCAIADLTGCGKDDILFLHKKDGILMKWKSGLASNWKNMGQIDTDAWQVLGCGRYSGGKGKDLLLRNKSTGLVGYYVSGDLSRWHEIGKLETDWDIIL